MLNNFIYAQEKSLFLEQLGAGNILDEAIVFIEDTGEIWNHGTYFAGDCGFDPEVIREIQTAVANLKASKQDSISDLATIRIGASAGATAVQPETLNNYVPTNRTINGKSLTNNISLSASDVGAPAIGELNTTNTNVSDLTSKVSSLTTDYSAFKQVFSDNSDEYINTWGEVKNFLDGIKNTEDLNNILLGINTQLGNKADKSQLSGYLPLSGGELNGGLIIKNNSGLYFKDTSGKGILALYVNSANKLILGAGAKETGYSTYIEGTNVYVNNNFCINSSGNVSIATYDYAGTTYRFAVGNGRTIISAYNNSSPTLGNMATSALLVGSSNYGVQHWITGDGFGHIQVGRFDGTATAYHLILQELGGYVGIGVVNPLQKLHVAGNILLRNYDSIRFFKSDGTTQVESLTLSSDNEVILGGDTNYYGLNTIVKGYRTIIKTGTYNTPALIIDENCNAAFSSRLLVNGATDDGTTSLQVNGDIHVTGNIIADGQVRSTGRLRINTSNSVNSFGFLKATAYTNALNVSVMHIGSNYGGTSTLTSETMDVVAMSMYRGVLGVGKEYTYDELYANYKNSVSLMVTNNMAVNGNLGIGTSSPTQKLDVRGNQYITGYIYADGDLNTGQWLRTYKGVAFGSAHTLTFNHYSIISNAELSFTNISTTDISTGIKAAIKAGMIQANDIIGHRIFLGNNSAGTASNQAFSICKYGSVVDTAPSNITELLKVDPSGAVTINGSLSVTGNIISSNEYLGASNVLDNPEYASYPSSGSSMEMHSDIRNFVNNGTVVRKDGKLYVKDNPFAPVTTHWLDIFSDPTEIGGYNYSGPIELDLYPDRFYDFTNSLFISSIKINSIPGWDNPGLISHNIVRFRPTNTAFSLTLPSDIYWADGKPFEVDDNNAVYEMSFIVRNGGVITATWTKFMQA